MALVVGLLLALVFMVLAAFEMRKYWLLHTTEESGSESSEEEA